MGAQTTPRDVQRLQHDVRRGSAHDLNLDSIGQGDYGASGPPRGGGQSSGPANNPNLVSRLKRRVRDFKDAYHRIELEFQRTQAQVKDLTARQARTVNSHQLEVNRLKKECDYHKRLRQAAEQRAQQLELALSQQQRHMAGFDEAQTGLIEQSEVLLAKNSELNHRLQQMERELSQQKDAVDQLTLQLEHVSGENEQLRLEYDQMAAGKFSQVAGYALSDMNLEDDYDLDLYGEGEAGAGGQEAAPGGAAGPAGA